jgi:hypothetical protein
LGNNNNWAETYKNEYAYDYNKNLIMKTSYLWNNMEWTEYTKNEYTYDLRYPLSELLVPESYSYKYMLTEIQYFNWNGSDWVESELKRYYYFPQEIINTTHNIILPVESITVFPNPVQDMLYIRSSSTIEQVNIHDVNGKTVKQIYNPNQWIEVNDLAKGIYILKITTTKGTTTRKIIKN